MEQVEISNLKKGKYYYLKRNFQGGKVEKVQFLRFLKTGDSDYPTLNAFKKMTENYLDEKNVIYAIELYRVESHDMEKEGSKKNYIDPYKVDIKENKLDHTYLLFKKDPRKTGSKEKNTRKNSSSKRCARGTKRYPPKIGNCLTSQELKAAKDMKRTRCARGTKRYPPKTGNCLTPQELAKKKAKK